MTRVIMDVEVVHHDEWFVKRKLSIMRQELEDGRVEFVVRVSDQGREKDFINRTFTRVDAAKDFAKNLKEQSNG